MYHSTLPFEFVLPAEWDRKSQGFIQRKPPAISSSNIYSKGPM